MSRRKTWELETAHILKNWNAHNVKNRRLIKKNQSHFPDTTGKYLPHLATPLNKLGDLLSVEGRVGRGTLAASEGGLDVVMETRGLSDSP